ncbi:AGC family protein kinase [Trichomonas vaginalis G3]|uniref:non-specific serine/threonine protein kinase n=1 Tax=Trichomonas vaginalis (strain ATCC PRA-98 / G3) TaxID=412133 RepID=A2F4Q4_TRIV3|nr:STKc MAST like domain-containing protein [Trichomonas vaginalis G3]EAY00115.1 AGC family protein kinase [Trichomonas vaginalis G3]KAI5552268.1 STKc MAST like domain-containing protein [Trichomonas vaginalis G3]|eukprot:XP_001313044.1 AGC family protein kinase [Trichomonas vaginalis G3]
MFRKSQLIYSSFNIFDQKSLGSFPSVNNAIYVQVFFVLKSQRYFLEKVLEECNEHLQKSPNDSDTPTIKTIIFWINKLLQANYGTLFKESSAALTDVRSIIQELAGKVECDVLYQFFNIIISIQRALIKLVYLEKADKNNSDEERKTNIDYLTENSLIYENEKCIVCRICNEKVPISLIEEHTNSCLSAVQSEEILTENDQKLFEYCQKFSNEHLDIPWPGEQMNACRVYLPHLTFLCMLENACQVETISIDAIEELENIGAAINSLDININKTEAKSLILKKIVICSKIEQARDILRITRVSGSGEVPNVQANISDFELIERISSGAYARVYLAKKKLTGDIFAIKVLPKSGLVQKNQLKRILLEKDILLQFNNPYVTNFYYSIIGTRNLYLVMEYIGGGDLFSLLEKFGCFDEGSARIYTYQIVRALQYLYQNGIIHRDLKPDNILVTSEGYLKLADFGLSHLGMKNRERPNDTIDFRVKENVIQSHSLVGTPDYISPEIILGQPHSFTTDYWSLGVIVYEMLTGAMPFHTESEQHTFKNIVKGIYAPLTDVSPDAADFVKRLLYSDPRKRLGCHGPDEILNHPWLKDLDDTKISPPWVPETDIPNENFQERRFPSQDKLVIPDDINLDIYDTLALTIRPRNSINFGFSSPESYVNRMSSSWFRDEEDTESISADDELLNFPSVHIDQLSQQNKDELKKINACKSSISFTLNVKEPASSIPPITQLESSFSFSGKKRRLRKRAFSDLGSLDDSCIVRSCRPPTPKE